MDKGQIDLVKYQGNIKFKMFPKLLKKTIDFFKEELDDDIRKEINKLIINSDMYKGLMEEYDKYIDKLAMFFKREGVTDGLGITMFYKELLEEGYLSYNKINKYNDYMLGEEYRRYYHYYLLPFIGCGCKVVTGKSVCRHNTDLLVKLGNRVGVKSLYTFVFDGNEKVGEKKPDHALAIIIDNDIVFGYCPTIDIYSNILKRETSDNIGYKYFYLKSIEDNCNFIAPLEDNEDYINNLYNNFDYLEITNEYVKKRYSQILIQRLDEERDGILEEFYNETKPNLDIINRKVNELSPTKKGKLKQLIIK